MLRKNFNLPADTVRVVIGEKTSGPCACPQIGCDGGYVKYEEFNGARSWEESSICRCCDGKGFLSNGERPYQAYIIACRSRNIKTSYPSPFPMSSLTYESEKTLYWINTEKTTDTDPNKPENSCFIATATYEKSNAPAVIGFRNFRDNILLNSHAGRNFATSYYKHSPKYANIIRQYKFIRFFCKIFLNFIYYGLKFLGLTHKKQ